MEERAGERILPTKVRALNPETARCRSAPVSGAATYKLSGAWFFNRRFVGKDAILGAK
jgi:hypothetical protein